MNIHKLFFVMVFLATPLIYFSVAFIWGSLILEKNTWANLSDNLSIMGIYYFLVSIIWLVNLKNLEKVSK